MKYHLDPGGVGVINATENSFRCNKRLIILSGEINVQFIVLLSPFDGTQRPVYEGITSNVIMNYHLDPLGVGASRCDERDNATENCFRCNRGLVTLPGEVNVQFIVLPSLFDGTYGGNVSQVTSNIIMIYHLDLGGVVASRCDNAMKNCFRFYKKLVTLPSEVDGKITALLSRLSSFEKHARPRMLRESQSSYL